MNDIETEKTYSIGVYASRNIEIVSGSGATLRDADGNEYIDCSAGVGVASLGHGHPDLTQAVSTQANRLMALINTIGNDVRARCMEKLASVSPPGLSRVYLCNSGAESIEAALKFARQSTGRSNFVCAMRGFHGRTFGALSATANKKYQAPFAPLVPGFSHAPYNQIKAFDALIDDKTAAVLLELVQGEGGVRPANGEFISEVSKLCKDRGALLILDEIQTGFCRTGRMFACEHFGISPDILCMAKGMAGGIPMGATVVNEKVQTEVGTHGSTFGGNPLASAACLKTVEIMKRDALAERAARLGDAFVERLTQECPQIIRQVRHMGLMIGIELKTKATPFIQKLQNSGILVLPAGSTVIRLLPPLVIEEQQLDQVREALVSVLQSASVKSS